MRVALPLLLLLGLVGGVVARASFPVEEIPTSLRAVQPVRSASGPATTPALPEDAPLDDRLAAVLTEIPPPSTGGSEVIEGVVRTWNDEPFAGLEIRALPLGNPPGHGTTVENIQRRDLQKYIVDRVAEHRWHHAGVRTAVSDADGRFRIEGLAAVRHRIVAELEGHRVEVRVDWSTRGWVHPGEEVVITVTELCPVRIGVRFPDGTVPPTARINGVHHWSAEAPVIEFPPGQHSVEATSSSWFSPPRMISVRSGEVTEIELELRRASGFTLEVRLPEGEPHVSLTARYLALAPGEAPDPERLPRHGTEIYYEVDAEAEPGSNRLECHRLPPADYLVGVGRSEDAIDVWGVVTVRDAITPLVLDLPALHVEEVIEVRALDHTGAPLASFGCDLFLRGEGLEGWRWLNHATVYRPDGAAWLRPGPEAIEQIEESGLDLWATVHAADLGIRRVPVDGPVVVVQFAAPAEFRLEIPGWDPDEDEGELFILDASGQQQREEWIVDLEESIGPLESGEYRFEFIAGGIPIEPFRVSLGPGMNVVTIEVPPRFTVQVEMPVELEGVETYLLRRDGSISTQLWGGEIYGVRENSAIEYEGLLPGEYVVVVADDDTMRYEHMPLSVRGNARVPYRGRPYRAMLVRFADRPWRVDPELRDGDVIVGVEGTEFETALELHQMLWWVDGGGRTFLVDRPGTGRVEVTISGGGLEQLFDSGAQLIPFSQD